jgi:hypothetical protein
VQSDAQPEPYSLDMNRDCSHRLAPSTSVQRLLKDLPTRSPAGMPKASFMLLSAQRMIPAAVAQSCKHATKQVHTSLHAAPNQLVATSTDDLLHIQSQLLKT